MTDEPIPAAAPVDGGEALGVDTPCIHCGYNLRGLTRAGRCPECGQPVEDSTRGNLLRFADPAWLGTLRKGAALKLWNILFMIVVGIGATVITVVTGSPLASYVMGLIGAALGLWATFLITSQEPSLSLSEDPAALRRVIRGCAIASFVGSWLPQLGSRWVYPLGGGATLEIVAGVSALLGMAGVVAYFGELVYLRRFARRIPNEKLVKSTSIVLWLLPAGVGLLVMTGAIAAIAGGVFSGTVTPSFKTTSPSGLVTVLASFTGCFGGLLLCVGAVWYIALLMKYRSAFAEAATLSRAGADG